MSNENAKTRYGFIFPIVSAGIEAMRCLCLVELFKLVAIKLARKEADVPRFASIAIDIFVVAKWLAVGALWFLGVNGWLATTLVIYLLATNVFIYFFKHVWESPRDSSDENRRRRFVILLIALAYNVVGFAYLYDVPFGWEFRVEAGYGHTAASFLFSAAHSVFVDFAPMTPTTSTAYLLALTETLSVFLFVTIVLSVSIPQLSPRENATN